MRRNDLDIFLAMFLTGVSVLLIILNVDFLPARIIIGFLLVFVLPGYLFSVLLFPETTWPILERIVLTLGSSLVISMAGGLIMYVFSIPLNGSSWILYFGIVIMIFGCSALYRRRQLPQLPGRRVSDTRPIVVKILPLPSAGQFILFGIAMMITFGAVAFAQKTAILNPRSEIVQLWMLPEDQENGHGVRIGVLANETAPGEYSLWLERDGTTIQEWPKLTLQPNEVWEETVSIDADLAGSGPLEAYLYIYGQPNIPYRHVNLWPDQLELNK